MVQQMDSKVSEYGLNNAETGFPSRDKQSPVVVKKAPLRDIRNDNRVMVPKAIGNSPFSKEKGSLTDSIQISGTKRSSPECPVSPPCYQSPSSNAGHLVYVRRKSEADMGRTSTCESKINNTDCQHLKQPGQQQDTVGQISQTREAKFSCLTASAPFPGASFTTYSSLKPSLPLPLGKAAVRFPLAEPSYINSNATPMNRAKRRTNENWEERSLQLQMLLRKLDQSNQEDYLQMLRALSSVELSRHAVELEKKTIQLALEEGKEMERVLSLDVLGKFPSNSNARSTQ